MPAFRVTSGVFNVSVLPDLLNQSVDRVPTVKRSQVYYAILFKGLEHLRIWVSTEDPGTTIPMDVAG